MPTLRCEGSSPIATPELAAHAAGTGTSPASLGSLAFMQPGSGRSFFSLAASIWPSLSSSIPFAHWLVGTDGGGGGDCEPPPPPGFRPPPPGALPRPSRARTPAAAPGAGLPHSCAATAPPTSLQIARGDARPSAAACRAASPSSCTPPAARSRSVTAAPEAADALHLAAAHLHAHRSGAERAARPGHGDRQPAALGRAADRDGGRRLTELDLGLLGDLGDRDGDLAFGGHRHLDRGRLAGGGAQQDQQERDGEEADEHAAKVRPAPSLPHRGSP